MPSIYDISVPILNGGVIYPGNPSISITPQQEISKGGSSNVSTLSFGSHTATHVDAPKHFFDDGAGVERMPLDILIGPAIVIAMGNDVMAVGEEQLRQHEIAGHSRVLIKTRNSGTLPGTAFIKDYTYVAPDGAEYLVSLGVKLVGVDYLSVEQFHSGHHRTHRTLLGNGIIIVEGLDLSGPAMGPYHLTVLPLLLPGLDGAPARAVLVG